MSPKESASAANASAVTVGGDDSFEEGYSYGKNKRTDRFIMNLYYLSNTMGICLCMYVFVYDYGQFQYLYVYMYVCVKTN